MSRSLEGSDRILQTYWRDDIERAFWPLTAPLTSTDWDGDAYGTVGKTLIDVSTVFGTPPGVRALLCYVAISDVGSDTADCYLVLSPNDTDLQGMAVCAGATKQQFHRECIVVPTDANGDIYYQSVTSGAGTMSIVLQVWGYWRHAGR